MNNNDKKTTPYGDSSTPYSQPGDANAKTTANAGGQNPNRPQGQNQPQKQALPEQQQQLQQKPIQPQGVSQSQVAGKADVAGRPEHAGKQGCSDAKAGHSDAECQEAMKKMEAAGTPGPAHKALEPMIGNWKAEVKCWKDGAGEAHVSHGTAKTHWILQGRFLQEDFSGEMMGKPFKGLTLLGYDNTKQTYNLVWLADTQTSTFTSEGKGDGGNKVITLKGQATCPMSGGQKSVESVYRILGADKHVFEMSHDGKKTLEVSYTRA
ncbi:MAG TPA: DUF1579 family protein [Candidatus Limnocylindria bacterium]|jgi:hypothetical protein|nr:DUF1579 family protein [Candidatus Limnocylindria bacterium]